MSSTQSMHSAEIKPSVPAVRDSGPELLRIFAMIGVVILHYNGGLGHALELVQAGSAQQMLLYILEAICICAVNVYLLISGYYSCMSQKRELTKAARLLLQVVAFNAFFYLIDLLGGQPFKWSGFAYALLPANYFVIRFIALYILSPYINVCLRALNHRQLKKLLFWLMLLFSIWPLMANIIETVAGFEIMGVNPVGAYGDSRGYTFLNFAFIYMIGASLRFLPSANISSGTLAVGWLFCVIVLTWSGRQNSLLAWAYNNPFVIAEAVFAFMLFQKMRLKSRFVNEMAGACFTCFLFHSRVLPLVNVQRAVSYPVWLLACHACCTGLLIFLLSWCVYRIYFIFEKPALKIVKLFFDKTGLQKLLDEMT